MPFVVEFDVLAVVDPLMSVYPGAHVVIVDAALTLVIVPLVIDGTDTLFV